MKVNNGTWKYCSKNLFCKGGTDEREIGEFELLIGDQLIFEVKSVHTIYQAVIREVEFFGRFL